MCFMSDAEAVLGKLEGKKYQNKDCNEHTPPC